MEKMMLSEKKKRIIKEKLFICALLLYPLLNFAINYILLTSENIRCQKCGFVP